MFKALRVEHRPHPSTRDWVIIRLDERTGTETEGGRYATKGAATRYFNRLAKRGQA